MTAQSYALAFLLLGTLGCPAFANDVETPPVVDLEREREAIRAAETAFAEMVAGKEQERFEAFFHPDAVFHSETVHRGPEAIRKVWGPFFDPQHEMRLEWAPREIQVAESGEIAWSSGGATMHMKRPWGDEAREDRYLTLWQKDAEGSWKIRANGSLVVYPDGAEIRDLRRAVSGFWDPLAQLDAEVDFSWKPGDVLEAASGEMAFTVGTYRVEVRHGETTRAGEGGYFSVWKKIQEKSDFDPRWVIAAESFSPPQ